MLTQYPLPEICRPHVGCITASPVDIAVGSDANLWFTDVGLGAIGRITVTGVVTEFGTPRFDGALDSIAAARDGNLWFTIPSFNRIGRITTEGVIATFPLPAPGSTPSGIAAGPDGNLWMAETGSNKIGRISLSPVAQIAVFRPTTGEWLIRRSFDGSLGYVIWGATEDSGLGDTPVPADYDAMVKQISEFIVPPQLNGSFCGRRIQA